VRDRSGVLKPVIVVQLLAVMMLAGVGTAFAVDPNAVGPSATHGPGSFTITKYVEVYNTELTQITGIIVTVRNKDDAPHSGTVKVAIEQEGNSVTGQGPITDLAGGDTIEITVNLGPISIGNYQWRVIVTQTS
jgi:hypothetical protein